MPGRDPSRRPRALLALVLIVGAASRPASAAELRSPDGRMSLAGSLATWDVIRLHDDTPSERPTGLLDLRLDATTTDRWRVFTSLRAGYDGKIGHPRGGNPFLALDEVYQSKDLFLNLDEAYVDLYFETFELRIGKQKISWGQLDDIQPTDHFNPQDLTEFYFRPELERKMGVPAIRWTGYVGATTLDVAWNPIFTSSRLAAPEDRWFAPLLRVPETFDTPFGPVPVATRYPDVDPPPHTLASSDVAIRLKHFHEGVEMSLTGFHGWDKWGQTYEGRSAATVAPTGDAANPLATSVDVDVVPSTRRITVLGADLAMPLLWFALRAEAAWIHGRGFPLRVQETLASDPQLFQVVGEAAERVAQTGTAETVALPIPPAALERECLQWGIGLDWFVTERVSRRLVGREWLAGTFFLAQLLQTVIFDHDAAFIDDSVESLLAATIRQSFLDERLGIELKTVYNPNHGDWFVWPQTSYRLTESLSALAEARLIGGSPRQTIGQYHDHDGIKLGMRWSF
ncbi:MAG: hypothetical protein IT293_19545 [Deltaproteobacteria bacterium]|nr:hypothetical protein [Deltaproteobacteria bacterium]